MAQSSKLTEFRKALDAALIQRGKSTVRRIDGATLGACPVELWEANGRLFIVQDFAAYGGPSSEVGVFLMDETNQTVGEAIRAILADRNLVQIDRDYAAIARRIVDVVANYDGRDNLHDVLIGIFERAGYPVTLTND